jgi:serine O-acetyltransferase
VHPAPDNSTVVGIPGRVVRVRPEGGPLEHGRLPDPEGQAMDDLARRVADLEEIVRQLRAGDSLPVRAVGRGDSRI